jgi:translation initiation factor 1 (eIF-1/SUI1)
MTVAHQEIIEVEAWGRREGKRKEIVDTFASVQTQIEKAVKEIKKDFEL